MITEQEYKLLKNIVLSEYPVLKAYDALNSEEWDGWKPKKFDDIYNSIGELFRSIESDSSERDHLNLDGTAASGGHLVGFIDGYLIISWGFNSIGFTAFVEKIPVTIDKVRKNSYIYCEIDCMEFLRMYKIHKLWTTKKDKEITTTTQTTSSAQG